MCRNWIALFPTALLTALAGCGGGPKIVPVSGTVTVDGKPLTQGYIQVVPNGWRPAVAKIGPDGRFTLTTTDANDGCPVGTHDVAIIASEQVDAVSVRWHAPKKYADIATSQLTVTIADGRNDVNIDLTWAGGKPFVEKHEPEGYSD